MWRKLKLDPGILLPVMLISIVGIISIYSATHSGETGSRGGPTVFTRHVTWLVIGFILMLLLSRMDYHSFAKFSPVLYGAILLTLVYLLIFGHKLSGMKGWFRLGPISIQPSEFMKIAVIMFIAYLFSDYSGKHISFTQFVFAGAVAGLPMFLIAAQPDFGTALVFAAIFGVFIYTMGLSRKFVTVLLLILIAAGAFMWVYVLKDYQKTRIHTFLKPETDPQKSGYHIIQSRIAIGNGGIIGKGFCSGDQSKLGFVPEKHTDFIFPVFAEEFGFLGSAIVVALYFFLIFRCLRIAERARDKLGAFLAVGFLGFFVFHVVINLGTVLGLVPTIGIPLPLMSYGGSATLSTMVGLGLVLNVASREF